MLYIAVVITLRILQLIKSCFFLKKCNEKIMNAKHNSLVLKQKSTDYLFFLII